MLLRMKALQVCVTLSALVIANATKSVFTKTIKAHVSIPKIIWTTGEWSQGSDKVKKVVSDIGPAQALFERKANQSRAEEAFLARAPPGTEVRYIENANMDAMITNFARTLETTEGVHDVVKAFHTLRPGAFRADLWRLLALWAHGGIYVDGNIHMNINFNQFIDFEKDQLVLVADPSVAKKCENHGPAFSTAVMASSPRNKYLLESIKGVVQNIKRHSYEWCTPHDITGPGALGNIITSMPDYEKDIRIEYEWVAPFVRKIGHSDQFLCHMDPSLHDAQVHSKYHSDRLWNSHKIYCDENRPQDGDFFC